MNVLAVFAHPDDEVLAAGGSLAKHAVAGDDVRVVLLSHAAPSRGHDTAVLAINAAEIGGWDVRWAWSYPDQKFDTVPFLDLAQCIETTIQDVKPSIIYTHWIGDLNIDHKLTAQAVLTAARPLPGSTVQMVLGGEVLSSTEWGDKSFAPTVFVSLSTEHAALRWDALECYGKEMRDHPHARSLRQAHRQLEWRGAQCGSDLAEAFFCYRQIR